MRIDTGSPEWQAVKALVGRRIEVLKDQCCSVAASDAQRAASAARIDELRQLLQSQELPGQPAEPRKHGSY